MWSIYSKKNYECVGFGESFSIQRLLISEWEPYLLKTYFCEHTFKAISSLYQKIIRLLRIKGRVLQPPWYKRKIGAGGKMGKRKCVRSCKKFSWVDVSMGKTETMFFCNASMPFHPGSPVSLEWWFYFAREFGWFIVLSQSTDPLTPLPRIEGWSVSQFYFMKIYNMKGNIFKCPQPFWWISILGISNVITVYIWKILTKKSVFL